VNRVHVLLVSTYEMGRQPFGLASPAAWLRREGHDVACADIVRLPLSPELVRRAGLVAFHLPMHMATRLAEPALRTVRAWNPDARVCAYGIYAPPNADWLRSLGVDDVLGGEFEAELVALARTLNDGAGADAASPLASGTGAGSIPKLRFLVPDRQGLPPLERYATLQMSDGSSRLAGYTEASRGCRHVCRHCPIVPIYNGQFRVVPADVVLADVAAQVAAGARHITFGDPDFFNGPTHAMRVAGRLHAAHPGVSFDVTIKVEHLLRHRALLPDLVAAGCLFVTSAVESLDDRVLHLLDKGHTRRDVLDAVSLCRAIGVTLVPTFVAFHPWTTRESYCDLLDTIAELDLIEHVAPIQLAIRLLLPRGSRLLALDEIRTVIGPFDGRTLSYRWTHPDPGVDRLQLEVASLVGAQPAPSRHCTFETISALAHERAGLEYAGSRPARARATVPYLNEPWYC
jgi:radical SAM superfamily enzyme YgiQ (UPF0313 family)